MVDSAALLRKGLFGAALACMNIASANNLNSSPQSSAEETPTSQNQHNRAYLDFLTSLSGLWVFENVSDSTGAMTFERINDVTVIQRMHSSYKGSRSSIPTTYTLDVVKEVIVIGFENDSKIRASWRATLRQDGSFELRVPILPNMSEFDRDVQKMAEVRRIRLLPTEQLEFTGSVTPRYTMKRTNAGEATTILAKATARQQQEEREKEEVARKLKQQQQREKREASAARWQGIYNAIQVTGAILNEDAAQTQVDLAETIARAERQGAEQQVEQAAAAQQQQSESTRYAGNSTNNSPNAPPDVQANIVKMKQSLQTAIDNDLDPVMIQTFRDAIAATENAYSDDGPATVATASNNDSERDDAAARRLAEDQAARAAEDKARLVAVARQRETDDRKAREAAAVENKKQALADHLTAEQRGIRLHAIAKCPSADGAFTITGTRPNVTPKIANCINVRFEARCPGTQRGQGVQDTMHNYTGGNSCYGDTLEIPAMSCPAGQVGVEVLEVTTGCG